MIVSGMVKIEKIPDVAAIENALREKGMEPLRWAVVEVLEDAYRVSVSYIK